MRYFLGYWIIGCLLVGASVGTHEKRCPRDPGIRPLVYLTAIAAWPSGLTWGLVSPDLSPCKVLP